MFTPIIPARALTAMALCLALLTPACEKKPARTTPQVLVPSIEAEPQPTPPPQPELNATPNPAPAPAQAVAPSSAQQKPKPKPRKPSPRKPAQLAQPAQAEQPRPEPAKPAAPNNSVQITAAVPRAAVQSQKQETEQLLRNSQGRLAGINRSLSDGEQGMLRQAHNYIAQSNQALQAGDIERAYNLAIKANLLANELTK